MLILQVGITFDPQTGPEVRPGSWGACSRSLWMSAQHILHTGVPKSSCSSIASCPARIQTELRMTLAALAVRSLKVGFQMFLVFL